MAFVPFQVKAVYEYTSPHEDDLHFPNGQIITVVEEEDEDWYAGEYMDASGVKQEGIFPRNFVEKYTPQAPPRPNRGPRPKKVEEPVAEAAAASASAPEPVSVTKAPEPESIPAPAPVEAPEPVQAQAPISIPVAPKPVEAESIQSPPAPKAASSQPAAIKSPPPPAAEKPISGSFRDRIAAFNKAAPPPVPYKPGGNGGGSSFIKKPFVAPPPSKNAYIPPPQQAPVAKIYRRDEDPEIAAREQEDRDNAEKAGLAPTSGDGEEAEPKPTSLKERIALLQKQQAEQAARHAESSAAAKKEKPKKPVKKKSESDAPAEGEEVPLEHTQTQESAGRRSIDDPNTEERQLPVRRKSSRGPPPPPPARSETDGNDADMSGAGDETEGQLDTPVDDSDRAAKQNIIGHPPAPLTREADGGDEEDTNEAQAEEEDDEEEDDIDPEVRRKEEIRARMAKMSGGMGMMGMFGGGMPMPGPPPPKKKKAVEKQHSEDPEEATSPTAHAPPIPIFPMPGMAKVKSRDEEPSRQEDVKIDESSQAPATSSTITEAHAPEEVADIEDVAPAPPPHTERPAARASVDERREVPPTPGSRPAPPPVPTSSRPLPPPLGPLSPTEGSASDDEMSQGGFGAMRTPTGAAPKFPPALPGRDERPTSSKQSEASYFTDATPTSPGTPGHARRQSRVPPIPGMTPGAAAAAGAAPQQARAPPPLPLLQPTLSRSSTGDVGARPPTPKAQSKLSDEEEVTEYEGDYDTDIAPTTHHKDALKAAEEDDDDAAPPPPVHAAPPPLPPSAAPRMPPMQMPPPLPSQPPPHHRQSSDMPRAAPPPPPRDLPPLPQPPPAQRSHQDYEIDGEEYDPYNYSSLPKSNPPPPPVPAERMVSYSRGDDYSDDLYSATPPRSPPPVGRNPPPPPPRDFPPPPQHMDRSVPPAPPRESRELQSRERELQSRERESASRGRGSIDMRRDGRRSMDMNRLAMEHDFIANDIDLGESAMWWAQPNGVPPAFHGRRDILHESEEATATKRGGRSQTTKDLYVLFPDYSQTIITVVYDTNNPQEASFEQKHEAPPARLRPDQLEESHERYGRRLHDAVASKKDSVVGDGTPSGLIVELLKPLKDALLPIGTRAYGALVYSNQGNSIVNQHDEIRPGDIVTFRNAKFQGKHGPMHAKYTAELGKGEGHVAIVAEWDGAKKKVRAWEQGRESKKVRMESFKLEDLRSGEVKIWRVMGRAWVGWEGQNS